jgi:uncharacterized repeat protein (TIGR01451 family)
VPGNLQAAPVYSGAPTAPLAPPATSSTFFNPFTPTVIGPPVAVAAPTSTIGPPAGAVPIGQDHLRITPDRVLAPVGSEVALKAGICGADGYMHTDRRVEWLLSRDGAGQFVDLGDRNEVDVFRWPWDTPRKVDNWYAIGSTAYAPTCLTRGTPDPRDDLQIVAGEAWITVTSATDGTSRVTAYAPAVGNWQFRQATTTIYWIDAQWAFPPSAVAAPGRPHTLTTTVTRRTDGAPLVGWTVRYDVSRGGSLGYAGGNSVNVPTDAAGRASVEVSPSDVGGGTATIGVTIIRPALAGAEASPQLEIGRGAATITWGSAPSSAPTAAPSLSLPPPPITPAPATSPPAADSGGIAPYRSPANETPAGPPRLEVRMTNAGPESVAVGGFVSFDVTVTNRGESTARNILVNDRFDPGLSHEGDTLNRHTIEYKAMRALAPNESDSVSLTFKVDRAGTLCHEVTVTADGVAPLSQRGCVTGRAADFTVTLRGPARRVVGEMAEFDIVVKNVGEVPAANVAIVQHFTSALQAAPTSLEQERMADGSLRIVIASMAANEQRTFRTQARCVERSDRACSHADVAAAGGDPQVSETCLEIVAPGP